MTEYAQEKVNGPGIALMVLGGLSILTNLAMTAVRGIGLVTNVMSLLSSGYADTGMWIALFTSSGWQVLMSLVGIIGSVMLVVAGTRLRGLKSAPLVYAGSIMGMLPCCVGAPCCCIGLPIGIWAIVTMQDEQVKAAFT
jgi:hypothetical protein